MSVEVKTNTFSKVAVSLICGLLLTFIVFISSSYLSLLDQVYRDDLEDITDEVINSNKDLVNELNRRSEVLTREITRVDKDSQHRDERLQSDIDRRGDKLEKNIKDLESKL